MSTTHYGQLFLKLAYNAVLEEEHKLKKLRADQYADVLSVWQYEEAWQQFVIIKQAIKEGIYPKLNAELPCGKKRIDLCFVHKKGHVLALFELKPGRPCPKIAESIVEDCEKLRDLGTLHAGAQRYVLGLLCGQPAEIETCERTLGEELQKSTVKTTRVSTPPDIKSNEGKIFRFVMLEIVTATALEARV